MRIWSLHRHWPDVQQPEGISQIIGKRRVQLGKTLFCHFVLPREPGAAMDSSAGS